MKDEKQKTENERRRVARSSGSSVPEGRGSLWIPRHQAPGFRHGATGFTLIEMIVVVGIIALLLSLLMAAVVRARAYAEKASIQAFLGHLSAGIDAYYADFGVYPSSTPSGSGNSALTSGSACLAEALMGFQDIQYDGAGPSATDAAGNPLPDPQYGFRISLATANTGNSAKTVGNGRIYGPYMKVDATNYAITASTETTSGNANTATDQYFTDPLGQRILYFKANPAVSTITSYFGTSTTGIFTTTDNPTATYGNPTTATTFLPLIGNTGGGTPANAGNNTINTGETPINQQSYLLVSPGINGAANSTWYVGGTGLYDSVVNSN